jgi:hypothetical protein
MSTLPRHILSLDTHPASFGFAVLSGAGELLDWGARRRTRKGERGVSALMQRQLLFLLKLWQPSCLVIRKTRMMPTRQGIIARIRRLAVSRSIPVRILESRGLEREFGKGRKIGQHEIANIVAKRFPALSWKLPPKRLITQNQPYHQSTFMAVAIGCAHLSLK